MYSALADQGPANAHSAPPPTVQPLWNCEFASVTPSTVTLNSLFAQAAALAVQQQRIHGGPDPAGDRTECIDLFLGRAQPDNRLRDVDIRPRRIRLGTDDEHAAGSLVVESHGAAGEAALDVRTCRCKAVDGYSIGPALAAHRADIKSAPVKSRRRRRMS